MSYYVHEGRIKNKAIIHQADCSSCNNGQGTRSDHNPKNHQWYGPISTLEEAWRVAQATKRKNVRQCLKCFPKNVNEG